MEKEAGEKVASKFLRTGNARHTTDVELLAASCDRLIQQAAGHSLKSALTLARRFASRAEPYGGLLKLTAYRALARVTHMSGSHREALKAYQVARRLAGKDKLVQARIDRALTDVYMYLGRFGDSEMVARRAMTVFSRSNLPGDLAQSRVNYGNLLHRQDRHREAAQIYREAANYFESTDNRVALARCYYNLANSLLQLFQVDEAEDLYGKARRMWEIAGCELDACDARYGLAWLNMLTGRLHLAMIELTACEKVYRDAGDPRGEALCALDRAEVFLHLGLTTDALDAARIAEKQFAALKLRYELSKASLFRGQAALALGYRTEAKYRLAKARRGFKRDRNEGFLGVVSLAESSLAVHDPKPSAARLLEAARHFDRSQLPLWQAVCDLKEAAVAEDSQPALNRLASNHAAQYVPHLFAMWQTTQGDKDYNSGRVQLARKCWQRAADRLDTVRAQLPPLELRTAYGRHQDSPHARLVELELNRDPLQAAVWSERQKTAGIWVPPLLEGTCNDERKRVEQSLQLLAGQVAALAHQVTGIGSERGRSPQSDNRVMVDLQKKIREEFIRLENQTGKIPDSVDTLREDISRLSQRHPIIQFHLRDADIIAFVHRNGQTTALPFEGGRSRLITALQRWRFILEAELLPEYPGHSQRIAVEEALWEEIGRWLWKPLGIDRLEDTILIVPEGELANLPWEALRPEGIPLGEYHRFVLSPSIRHFAAAQTRHISSHTVDVFRGAGSNLPYVDAELEALCQTAGPNIRLHAPANRTGWPVSGESRVWHYSGHALLREDNPFYSSLILEDGPLFAVDFRVKQCRVGLATLAACRSGEQVSLPGEESTGLVRSLLEMGARTVVAGRWPVSDQAAALWMKAFYHNFFVDSDILNASRKAAQAVRNTHKSALHWAAFAVFGAGDIGGNHDRT